MLPASTKQSGTCMGTPDVCKTPSPGGPVPIPYPNVAQCAQAQAGSFSQKVKFSGANALVQTSKISMSSGDEAGSAGGGVISNQIKGPCEYKLGSSKVKLEGKGAAYVTAMVAHNGSNPNMPAGAQVAPSQVKVMVAP
ncbi:MAG: DUF4150 domain-containing protein [Planctomycetes bacterium]|nr:DUF4150 domain-containing protein [Planctomycetota bacterium]